MVDRRRAASRVPGVGSAEELRRFLRRESLRPLKRRGQNFLVDAGVLEAVVEAAELRPDDRVLEIGPGLGVLTEALAARVARVVAVEKDARFLRHLRARLGGYENVELVHADVLRVEVGELVGRLGWGNKEHRTRNEGVESPSPQPSPLKGEGEKGSKYKVVANLPYSITSPVLHRFLTIWEHPSLMVVMVQWEVAQRVLAPEGSMTYLAALVRLFGTARLVRRIPASAFEPAPKVDSALLRIEVRNLDEEEWRRTVSLQEYLQQAYRYPRKQAVNSLATAFGSTPDEMRAHLEALGIDPRRRSETFSLEEWRRIAERIGG
jgi:16S rRNA (adenine1518-N6/adenine1519-N6)-dimethyltransferase